MLSLLKPVSLLALNIRQLEQNCLPLHIFQIFGYDASHHLHLTVPLNHGRNKTQVLQLQDISGKVSLN